MFQNLVVVGPHLFTVVQSPTALNVITIKMWVISHIPQMPFWPLVLTLFFTSVPANHMVSITRVFSFCISHTNGILHQASCTGHSAFGWHDVLGLLSAPPQSSRCLHSRMGHLRSHTYLMKLYLGFFLVWVIIHIAVIDIYLQVFVENEFSFVN